MIRFGFYGRVSTEDNQDPESSRGWQLTRSRTLIEPRGGQIVAEFFDVLLLRILREPTRQSTQITFGRSHGRSYSSGDINR